MKNPIKGLKNERASLVTKEEKMWKKCGKSFLVFPRQTKRRKKEKNAFLLPTIHFYFMRPAVNRMKR